MSGPEADWVTGRVPEALPDAVYRSHLVEAAPGRAIFRLPVGRFLLAPDAPAVVETAAGASDKDIACMLRGPVGALRSSLGGRFALRASAVEVGRRALVVCGSTFGVSTLVASLALRGHRLLADGVVVVSGTPPMVSALPEAGQPRVTLWPDSAAHLGLDLDQGQVLRPGVGSRLFALGPGGTPAEIGLGWVVSLAVDHKSEHPDQATSHPFAAVSQRVATLVGHQWHAEVVAALGLQAEQFNWAVTIGSAPMFRLLRSTGSIGLTLPPLAERAEELAV